MGLGRPVQGECTLRTNDESYSLGNEHHVTAWGSYMWRPWISTSVRLAGQHIGKVDGSDSMIMGPVQTANPDF